MKTLFLATCLILFAISSALPPAEFFKHVAHKQRLVATSASNFTQRQVWFTGQLVDHFNLNDNRTFSQRYWIIDQHWDTKSGPVILYICGEYTCPGLPADRLFPLELAQKYHALILVLEHRFYGQSQPFDDLSTEHFRYLNVDQALDDLAYFINWAKSDSTLNIGQERPWITYGGSYPGALSAWFRYKYPHLTHGAIASSAVINAIVDYNEYDHQLYLSALKSGEECPKRVQEVNKYVEDQVYASSNNASTIKAAYGAQNLTNEEFLNYFADSFAGLIQYGQRTHLCNDVVLANESFEKSYESIKNFVLNNNDPFGYLVSTIQNESYWADREDGRQWMWQTCTELGWFQTAYPNASEAFRSSKLNVEFFLQNCKDIFGDDATPDADTANLKRGGLGLNVENLIMVNGVEDPWQWASRTSDYQDVNGYFVNCENCAHCVELYTPTSKDSWNLWWARTKITYHVGRWFGKGNFLSESH